jgi:hypothetical protein
LQTNEEFEGIPKQVGIWQELPMNFGLQMQLSGDTQVPLPPQTLDEFEGIPKHTGY